MGKTMRHSKEERVVTPLKAGEVVGEIVCWRLQEGSTFTHKQVVTELQNANLDFEVAKEFLPATAFSRAAKKLEGERVIDVIRRDKTEILFQFTKKEYENIDDEEAPTEVVFSKEAVVRLNTITGEVSCKNQALKKAAQEALDHALETRTTTDITNIVQRLFEKAEEEHPDADLFPIRDQGGAYFVIKTYLHFVDQIETFVNALHGKVKRFPIPAGTKHGDKAVTDVIAERIQAIMKEHEENIEGFSVFTRNDSLEKAADKINRTRTKIEAYASYLQDRREDLIKGLDKLNAKLRKTVDEITNQKKNNPRPERNGDGAEKDKFGSYLHSKAHVINMAIGKKPKTMQEIMTAANVSHPIHAHLAKLLERNLVKKDKQNRYYEVTKEDE